jgi:hypothetical protein
MKGEIPVSPDDRGLRVFLAALSAQIEGEAISSVRHSVGSAFIIEFGPLSRFRISRRQQSCGRYSLLVEMASWSISDRRGRLLTSDDNVSEIRKAIQKIRGLTAKRVILRVNGDIDIAFNNSTTLSIKKVYEKGANDNWALSYMQKWWLSNADNRDNFIFELARLSRKRKK